MRKLKLQLDQLEVDSFATDHATSPRGTVNGHVAGVGEEPDGLLANAVSYSDITFCLPYCVSCLDECSMSCVQLIVAF